MLTAKEIYQLFPSVPAWCINYFLTYKALHLKEREYKWQHGRISEKAIAVIAKQFGVEPENERVS